MPRQPTPVQIAGAVVFTFCLLFVVFDYIGYFDRLWENDTHTAFYRDLIVLLIGIPIGYFVATIQERRQQRLEKEAQQVRRDALLAQLSDAVESNAVYAEQIVDSLGKKNSWPTFPMNISPLVSTTHLWHDVIQTPELEKDLGKLLFELQHLNQRLTLLTLVLPSSGSSDDSALEPPDKSLLLEIWTGLVVEWRKSDCMNEFMDRRNFTLKPEDLPTRTRMRMYDIIAGTIMLADSVQKLCEETIPKLNSAKRCRCELS